ncbi:PA14 domain-containing protein [Tepidiforma sp.]|uniref:PA14 domain-containing protein n=1 Tax=Tepidiforma sp. TaxID=2682230 RepID=UPI002ADD8D58|nr:PA14 domain-containing protein [Tepidiforma sp.]
MVRGIGTREVVALLAVAVAAVIAWEFLDPAASEGRLAPSGTPTVRLGLAPPSPTATPEPSPTPLPPPLELGRPARFRLELFDDRPTSGHVKVADGAVDGLALSYAGAPFPDLVDDRWSVVASAQVELPATGRYRFVLAYHGEVTVRVDGEVVAGAGPTEAGRLEVVFAHAAGPALLEIELRDRGGEATLRWE